VTSPEVRGDNILIRAITGYVRFYRGNYERAYISDSGIVNTSLAEEKEDIRDVGSALPIIKSAKLYRYHYISPPKDKEPNLDVQVSAELEPETSPERVGFVIGKGYEPPPECVLAEDGRGVSLYAMSSVCWRGVQELLARVEALERR